jgi:hypothetical protein
LTASERGGSARAASRLVRPRSAWVTAGVAFLLSWLTLIGLDVLFRAHQARPDFSGFNPLLVSLAGVAATLLGVLMMAQCRVARGPRPEFWMGLGIVLYGSVVLFAGELYPLGRHTAPVLLGCLPLAALLLVFGLVAGGSSRESDPTMRARRSKLPLLALGISILAAMIAVLVVLPEIAEDLAETALPSPASAGGAVAQLLLAAAWFGTFLLLLRRRPSNPTCRPRQFAVAIAVLGLAQAHLAIALSPGSPGLWVLGSHLFQLIGFAVALPMMALDFEQRVNGEHRQLFNSLIAAKTDSARQWAHQSIDAAYDHELRSTLLLVDGSVRMLVDRFDDLSDADRASFGRLIGSGVERLGVLLHERSDDGNEFELRDVVHSVVCAERTSGVVSTFEIAPGLRCSGRSADVAGVLHTLIRSTWARCQPAPVHLQGRCESETITLSIGPGHAADATVSGFPRRLDSSEAFGDTVDLQVAGQLLDDHGGTISTATDASGRILFEVRLPAAQAERELEGVL